MSVCTKNQKNKFVSLKKKMHKTIITKNYRKDNFTVLLSFCKSSSSQNNVVLIENGKAILEKKFFFQKNQVLISQPISCNVNQLSSKAAAGGVL